MVVYNVVCHWLSITVDYYVVVHGRLGHAVGWSMGVFYVYNFIVGLRDPEWLQGDLNVLIGLFLRIGLMANIDKSKTMMCQPGMIRSGILDEAVGQQSMGGVATYREILWCQLKTVGWS